jgi:hypothetical protein
VERQQLEKYGPFHRLQSAADNELVARTGMVDGRAARNTYEGPLPEGRTGIEFYTAVEPDPGGVPGCPLWSGPRAGVIPSATEAERVLIAVRIVKRVDR